MYSVVLKCVEVKNTTLGAKLYIAGPLRIRRCDELIVVGMMSCEFVIALQEADSVIASSICLTVDFLRHLLNRQKVSFSAEL